MGNKKILVIGSSNTDMTVLTGKMPAPGETVLGGEFRMGAGGKGANQAVAAARQGAKVSFLVKARPSSAEPSTWAPAAREPTRPWPHRGSAAT